MHLFVEHLSNPSQYSSATGSLVRTESNGHGDRYLYLYGLCVDSLS
jgi:hypothetical protein